MLRVHHKSRIKIPIVLLIAHRHPLKTAPIPYMLRTALNFWTRYLKG